MRKLCGTGSKVVIGHSKGAKIIFKSDDKGRGKGWRLKWGSKFSFFFIFIRTVLTNQDGKKKKLEKRNTRKVYILLICYC